MAINEDGRFAFPFGVLKVTGSMDSASVMDRKDAMMSDTITSASINSTNHSGMAVTVFGMQIYRNPDFWIYPLVDQR